MALGPHLGSTRTSRYVLAYVLVRSNPTMKSVGRLGWRMFFLAPPRPIKADTPTVLFVKGVGGIGAAVCHGAFADYLLGQGRPST